MTDAVEKAFSEFADEALDLADESFVAQAEACPPDFDRAEMYAIATKPVPITRAYIDAMFLTLIRMENDNGDTDLDRVCIALRSVLAEAAEWWEMPETMANHRYHGAKVLRAAGQYLFRPAMNAEPT